MLFCNRSTAFWFATLLATIATFVRADRKPIYPVKGHYQINTPREYAKSWASKAGAATVNPCLYGSIVAPGADGKVNVNYLYPAGFDVTWAGGYLSLQQYLVWNSDPAINDKTLIDMMALAVGFPPSYNYSTNPAAAPPAILLAESRYAGDWALYVFDGCKAAKRGNGPEVPTPAFWLNRLKWYYGKNVDQSTYNELVDHFWNIASYTGCSNNACWGAADFNNGITCGCNADFLAALQKFGATNPFDSSALKRTKNDAKSTANCYAQLSQNPTAAELRAALSVCEAAGAWNTGNGVGWNFNDVANNGPLTVAQITPSPGPGMTFPELVFANDNIRKLGAIAVPMGVWTN